MNDDSQPTGPGFSDGDAAQPGDDPTATPPADDVPTPHSSSDHPDASAFGRGPADDPAPSYEPAPSYDPAAAYGPPPGYDPGAAYAAGPTASGPGTTTPGAGPTTPGAGPTAFGPTAGDDAPTAPGSGPTGGGPGSYGAPAGDPPPITAFAWKHGLIRPAQGQGRMFAGVCGAFGRATNTDPVLWRVILVVLSVFGGIGVFVYLLAWLLLPAQGDSASPLEAVLGRGRSSTSAPIAVIVGVIVLISLGVSVSAPFRPGGWTVALIVLVAVLLVNDRRRDHGPVTASPAAPPPPVDTPSGATGSTAPTAFAPYGPFTSAPPPPAPPPPAPRPRPPRSRLGGLTFSVALILVGLVGLADLAGVSIPAATYVAVALLVVGLGMVLGAWYGRGRRLIALGIVLTIALGALGTLPFGRGFHGGQITWRPTSVSQVDSSYENDFGNGTLDLSHVDFSRSTDPVSVDVNVSAGNLVVILPPNVDTTVTAKVNGGNAKVFGQSWSGVVSDTATDLGGDGQGGGQLHLKAEVDFANLEVRR